MSRFRRNCRASGVLRGFYAGSGDAVGCSTGSWRRLRDLPALAAASRAAVSLSAASLARRSERNRAVLAISASRDAFTGVASLAFTFIFGMASVSRPEGALSSLASGDWRVLDGVQLLTGAQQPRLANNPGSFGPGETGRIVLFVERLCQVLYRPPLLILPLSRGHGGLGSSKCGNRRCRAGLSAGSRGWRTNS